jgi:hypothetical protein
MRTDRHLAEKGGERRDLVSAVRRHPLITFFVSAYVFSWWPWPLYILGLAASPVIGFGPFFAAVVVLALTGGKAGVVALLRRMVRWRVAPVWYAVALLLPVAINAAATVLNVLLGARPPSPAELGAWPGLIPTFLLLLVPGLGGALGRSRGGVATPSRSCKRAARRSWPA